MQLLSPWSLAWLGLLVPLVLLYVLKRRRTERVVGSTLLWELAQRDMRAERPWKRLVPHLSLLLQALALIAGAIALARPVGAGRVPTGARVAVVVDTSASMAARGEEGRRRIELARASARAIAHALPPGGAMMLIEAGSEPAVLAPSTDDVATLDRAIERLRTRGSGSSLEAAIALAAERLRPADGDAPAGSRIVVLTDASQDGEIVLPAGAPVEVQRVGEPRDNTAIVALDVRARPTDDAPDRAEIFARVARTGEHEAEVWVTASIAGREGIVASRRVRVAAGASEAVVMLGDLPPDPAGRPAVVRLELSEVDPGRAGLARGTGDGLDLDDVAVAPSPGARRLPVFLIGEPPESIRRVLLADRDVELFATTPEALAARRAGDAEAPDLDGLLVYSGAIPDVAPAGDALAIAPAGDRAFGVALGDEVDSPRLVTWDEGDPRLRFVSFRDVHLAAARPIVGASARAIVTSDAGPIAGVIERPDGEATLLAFDPDRSDWPRRPGFVIFVRNVLERVRSRRAAGGIPPTTIGEPLRVPAADGETVVVRAPDGSSASAVARGGVAIVEVPAVPGAYVAEIGRRRVHALRNLLSPAESDLSARARFVEREGGAEVHASERREPSESWPWLAGALLVVLAIEVAWATRRGAAS